MKPAQSKSMIAILGAGLATRFGGGKLLAPLAGHPLFLWAVSACLAVGDGPVLLVAGAASDQLTRQLPDSPRLRLIKNFHPEQGQGTSLALAATQAAREEAELLLITLADMPLVTPDLLRRVARAARRSPDGAAVCQGPGRMSPPAAFSARHFPALAALRGDQGARHILSALPGTILVPASQRDLADVDTPAQLAEAAALLGNASLYTDKT